MSEPTVSEGAEQEPQGPDTTGNGLTVGTDDQPVPGGAEEQDPRPEFLGDEPEKPGDVEDDGTADDDDGVPAGDDQPGEDPPTDEPTEG